MHFFRDLYAKLRASWCSLRDAKDILVTSKRSGEKSAQRDNELVKQVLVMVFKKSPYKLDIKSTALSFAKRLLRVIFL